MKTTKAQFTHRAILHGQQQIDTLTGVTPAEITPEPPTVDPLYCALRQLTGAREYLQSAMQQLDDPVLPMLIEDLAIIMQRLDSVSQRLGE
jgi:hypothetical protein